MSISCDRGRLGEWFAVACRGLLMSELSHLFEQALQDRSVSLDEFLAEHAEHAEELDQASDRRAVLTELASLDIAKCWERHSQQAIVLAQPVEPQELPDDSPAPDSTQRDTVRASR